MTVLRVDNLRISYAGGTVVDDVSFAVNPGETVALTGVSGAGKSQTALAIMGLLPGRARVGGSIRYGDTDIVTASARELRAVRARRLAMVFQDPDAALNPHLRVGRQLELILAAHGLARGRRARDRAVEMLGRVGLPDPARQAAVYPHQLSGGMRQRVLIASALIAGPSILIADEPTTALDTTVQAQILALLETLKADTGVSLLLITHDFGVIAQMAERVLVMDGGRIVESGHTEQVLAQPAAPSTRRLLAASTASVAPAAPADEVVFEIDGLGVVYHERPIGRIWRRISLAAVKPLTLALRRGETVAIVGESGSGKTSLARAITGLVTAAAGQLVLDGNRLPLGLRRRSKRALSHLQMVFQNSRSSLDPAMRIADSIAEPLRALQAERGRDDIARRVAQMCSRVGLDEALLDRFPGQLSGGQAQRAALARALIVEPRVLIADEAVAALDAPVRQQILACIAAEQAERGLSLLFISHDLGVVRQVSHRVLVLYLGYVVEAAARDEIFARPLHPYTRALIDAAPRPRRDSSPTPLQGEPGSVLRPPPGCVFQPRCRYAIDRCRVQRPELEALGNRQVACHRAVELDLRQPAGDGA